MYNVMYLIYRVDVIVKRCGGGFGGKVSRSNLIAAATALGAYVTKRYM
jgi:xanthine dehydrogenase molybdopterin-binding subunit B